MGRPLEGIKVIEIGQEIQGPFAGLCLADLGADGIKIENKEGGDLSRVILAGLIGGPLEVEHLLDVAGDELADLIDHEHQALSRTMTADWEQLPDLHDLANLLTSSFGELQAGVA